MASMLKTFLKSAAALCIVLAALELSIRVTYLARGAFVEAVPLPYHVAGDYGPTPPWVHYRGRLVIDDEIVGWRHRPYVRQTYMDVFSPVQTEEDRRVLLRRFFPFVPESLKNNPVWEITLNSRGFRDREFPQPKAPSAFRIVCLGDSWTFGANVAQTDAYPQRLATRLREAFPSANFEVLNLGVLGYGSYNGKKLLASEALSLDPDVVVLAFAMNESTLTGYRAPSDLPRTDRTSTLGRVVSRGKRFLLDNVEIVRLLNYFALLIRWNPWPLEAYLKNLADVLAFYDKDYDLEHLDERMQVSVRDFTDNYLTMIRTARSRGIGVILLFNEFWVESPYLKVLTQIARTENVPLVDTSALLARERSRIEMALEESLGLSPAPQEASAPREDVEVVFRVFLEDRLVPTGVYITGTAASLENFVPNRIAMYDDGTHGDQVADDDVWSYTATFAPGSTVYYLYTNSGRAGEWEGLDVPALRRLKVSPQPGGRRIYAPIDTFGTMYTYADPWHTNAAGNDLVARSLFDTLNAHEQVRSYLDKTPVRHVPAAQ